MFLFSARKSFAATMLMVMSVELLMPATASALTSGPTQPEMGAFKPIGVNDMVDLFSGDFSYNIPLVDVGGYPLNLSYQSGSSIDDESTWVGHGWTLNPGAVNRQLRGIPDDFNGSDLYTRQKSVKPQTVLGAKLSGTIEAAGIPLPKLPKIGKRKKKMSLISPQLSLMVKSDNYRGIGVDFGVNTGLSLTDAIAEDKNQSQGEGKLANTSKKDQTINSIGTGLTLSSFDGASVNVSFSVNQKRADKKDRELGMSIGFPYNSRAGLSMMTLSGTNNKQRTDKLKEDMAMNTSISFNDQPFYPNIDMPRRSDQYTFSIHAGGLANMIFAGGGISGFYSWQGLRSNERKLPAYGTLYGDKGRNVSTAMLDFNREKDIPYTKEVPYLPIPVQTHDIFSASSQSGSGQYRIYRGSAATFFDPFTRSGSESKSAGVEVGAPFFGQAGFDVYYQTGYSRSNKWTKNNRFLATNDYIPTQPGNLLYESVYFKRVGEPVPVDQSFLSRISGIEPVAASITPKYFGKVDGGESENRFRTKSSPAGTPISAAVQRTGRDVRNNSFSYLTAAEAAVHGLDKLLQDFDPGKLSLNGCDPAALKSQISRVGSYRKRHHISEITITAEDGKRTVYGIPVYNTYQEDVTFSTNADTTARKRGLVRYARGVDDQVNANTKGLDNLVNREITPAYTTGYLLTGILSPEYRDLTGNGITDDDHGDAVKFNYTRLNGLYKWRTPFAYGSDTANYNEGLLSDPDDDKANYSYGEKEVWYMHSVESKTMVAYFILEDRDDGLGVQDKHGAVSTQVRLKRLRQIRLFSKADIKAANGVLDQVTPIKTVHFEYDYSLVPGLPNNATQGGKLTLKKVWFTYGLNNKGRLHPYEFVYSSDNPGYSYRQYDRWGSWKDPAQNPGGMNNSEFPYTDQNRSNTDRYVSAGQLVSIKLPSGGAINVTYESDDYTYVQNKRASVMAIVAGAIGASGTPSENGLIDADEILVNLPWPATENEIKTKCFNGTDKLYFKFLIDLDAKGHKEFVPGYANILSVAGAGAAVGGKFTQARIRVEKNAGVNPIAAAGWQFIRLELPKYAYPGSQNLNDPGTDLTKAIKALGTAAKTLGELFNSFEKTAKRRKYADNFDASRSWIKIGVPERKLGGGSRVKKVEVSDNWAALSNTPGAITATLSQVYDYTTKDEDGTVISSGVASYEPSLGGDENPFRQPVPYKEKQFLGLNTNRYIELPIGESFFPSPSVGYSRITVRNLGSGDAESVNRTGTVVNEFYTAKDFPTKVTALPIDRRKPSANKILSLVGVQVSDLIGLSQGYSVEVNDMHGKPRSTTVLNVAGDQISKVENFYKTVNEKAATPELSNTVKVVAANNLVSDGMIGMDVEIFHDSREQLTENVGVAVKFSAGLSNFLFIPVPFVFPGIAPNYDKRSYRALSTVKLIQRFGIVEKVKKTENGSSVTTTNLLWDGVTGNVLLTSTQNEFNDPVFSFTYPAHWRYPGMGAAYQNAGTIYQGLSTGTNGVVSSTSIAATLFPGDELIDLASANRYWVVRTRTSTNATVSTRIINAAGDLASLSNVNLKLVRPGRRNMSNTAIGTVVSLRSPVVNKIIVVNAAANVLDNKAFTFNEEWAMPVANGPGFEDFYACFSKTCLDQFMWSAFSVRGIGPISGKTYANFFANSANNMTAGSIMSILIQNPESPPPCISNFYPYSPQNASSYNYFLNNRRIVSGNATINNGDGGRLGQCTFTFSNVNTAAFNRFANTSVTPSVSDLQNLYNARLETVGTSVPGQCIFDFRVSRTVLNYSCSIKGIPTLCASNGDTTLFRITINCPVNRISNPCLSPLNRAINPYVAGILGNWRMTQSYAFQENRTNPRPSGTTSTNIRAGGTYNQVVPFWSYSSNNWNQVAATELRWIASNEMTLFNTKGLELENKDALNRFSSAQFGYLESMPVAVASNAMNREIGYDGFEDAGFNLDCNTVSCPIPHHLDIRSQINGGTVALDPATVHSGKFSLRTNQTITISRSLAPVDANNQLVRPANFTYDANGRYLLNGNELAKGFSPMPNKDYVISFWVKDNNPSSNKTNLSVVVNGATVFTNLNIVQVVEKWKRVEARFRTSASGNQVIQIVVSGQMNIDDLRIHPYDAQMKSFVYDPRSTRLMAELDENNFSTFYEYDDEGVLIRVKKETERGIMTIKETRSSMKKTGS